MRPWWDGAALNLWVERFARGFFIGFSFLCFCAFVVFLALVAQGCLEAREARRETRRRIEAWRRDRLRAPIVKAGIVEGDVAKKWVFWFWQDGQANPPLVDHDPLTGEPVHFGYSLAELRAISANPKEHERPELVGL